MQFMTFIPKFNCVDSIFGETIIYKSFFNIEFLL